MDRKRTLLDPSLWVLIGINVYLTWYYYHQPGVFTTLLWLYWAQSVMLGLFNFLDMLTIRQAQAPDKETSGIFAFKRPAAFFFLFHYGFFHFVYFFFLLSMKSSGPFQWPLFKNFLLAFIFGQVINFIQHKIQQRKQAANLGAMFFIPYLRIVPMHLTILLPNFLPISNLGIFVVLKSVADVLMYVVTNKTNKKDRTTNQAMLATNQSMNL